MKEVPGSLLYEFGRPVKGIGIKGSGGEIDWAFETSIFQNLNNRVSNIPKGMYLRLKCGVDNNKG